MQRFKSPNVSFFCAGVLLAAIFASDPGGSEAHQVPTIVDPPCRFIDDWILYYDGSICVEMVYDNVTSPEAIPALMGLAFSPDGTLYFARTAFGEVWAMSDQDGDHFFDTQDLVADDLRLPSGVTVYEDTLYVFSADGVVLFDSMNGERVTRSLLKTNFPLNTGFWAGSVQVGPDERVYIGLGSDCDECNENERRGTLLSYSLDGSDEQVMASGFRYPADFAWHPVTGDLWSIDSGRVTSDTSIVKPPDELNLVKPGADYGFPACYGKRVPDPEWGADDDLCSDTRAPHLTFPYQSNPSGMVFYTHDAFPAWKNNLIVVLRGSWNLPEPAGYSLSVVEFNSRYKPVSATHIIPYSTHPSYVGYSLAEYSLSSFGFFPYHPSDVVISPEGWLYVSIEEGRIIRLRPNPV